MNRPEQRLQQSLIKWWSYAHSGFRVDERLLIHVPNGGKRSRVEAAIFKSMGVRAGVPDLLLFHPAGSYYGLAIELKAKDGRLSIDQSQMLFLLCNCGWRTSICWSFDEAVGAITKYLKG